MQQRERLSEQRLMAGLIQPSAGARRVRQREPAPLVSLKAPANRVCQPHLAQKGLDGEPADEQDQARIDEPHLPVQKGPAERPLGGRRETISVPSGAGARVNTWSRRSCRPAAGKRARLSRLRASQANSRRPAGPHERLPTSGFLASPAA